jgi:hypothetical protein
MLGISRGIDNKAPMVDDDGTHLKQEVDLVCGLRFVSRVLLPSYVIQTGDWLEV